jgi:hypothetical protein
MALSERIRERLAEESFYALRVMECIEASRNRWVVPTQENNREKWSFREVIDGKTNRVAPREYL